LHYLIVSFTHKNTTIDIREKLAFNNNLEKKTFLATIISCGYINEAILTSTCNRVEILASATDIKNSSKKILQALHIKSKVSLVELEDIVEIYDDENAVRHIFTVVSSLDSLVIGETQIVGQFKDAFRFSRNNDFINKKLTRLTNYAFKCAKEVRNVTNLGAGSVSIASAAVSKAKEIFKNDDHSQALVVGIGEMGELATRHFLKSGFKIILVNRDMKKAQLLASTIISSNKNYTKDMIDIQPYDNLSVLINSARLLITATSSPVPIITDKLIKNVNFNRYWFDISIPRNIASIKNPRINIYVVDDLKDIIDQNINIRATQAKKAYHIIFLMAKQFYEWIGSLGVESIIKNIYQNADKIIEKKIANAIKKYFIKPEDKENVTKLCDSVIKDFLHTPTKNLRDSSKKYNSDRLINTAKLLYGINSLEETKEHNDVKKY